MGSRWVPTGRTGSSSLGGLDGPFLGWAQVILGSGTFAACAASIGRRRSVGAARNLLMLGAATLTAPDATRWVHVAPPDASDNWFVVDATRGVGVYFAGAVALAGAVCATFAHRVLGRRLRETRGELSHVFG